MSSLAQTALSAGRHATWEILDVHALSCSSLDNAIWCKFLFPAGLAVRLYCVHYDASRGYG